MEEKIKSTKENEQDLIINALEMAVSNYSAIGMTLIQLQDEVDLSYSKLKVRLNELENDKRIKTISLTKIRNNSRSKLYCLTEITDCIINCYIKKKQIIQQKLES